MPSTAKIGQKVTLNVCTKNIGNANATAFKTTIYHSTFSMIFPFTALAIADIDYPKGLAAGKTDCKSVTLVVPAAVQPGNNYFGPYADSGEKVKEDKEDNNDKASLFRVATYTPPDLIVSQFVPSKTNLALGQSFTAKVCIKNAGKGAVQGPFKVGILYSPFQSVANGGTQFGEISYTTADLKNFPASSKEHCRNGTFKFPTNISDKSGYIGAMVDYKSQVYETSDFNNEKVVKVTINNTLPNLTIAEVNVVGVTGNIVLAPGAKAKVKVCYDNQGTRAGAFKLGVYLSKTFSGPFSNRLASKTFSSGLPANAKKACTEFDVTVPSNTPDGAYYFGAWIDYEKKVTESDENNTNSLSFDVKKPTNQPDLLITSVTGIPAASQHNKQITAKVCVKNDGKKDITTPFRLSLYLSKTTFVFPTSLNLDNHTFKTSELSQFKAGSKEVCKTFSFLFPTQAPLNTDVFIAAWVDDQKKVTEYNESNNQKYTKIKVAKG